MLRCLAVLGAISVVAHASAAEPLKVAQRWALLVGIDDYAYAQKLNYCGADQVALAKQLIAAGFPDDHVFLLHDKAENPKLRPSFANIERHLELVVNLADVGDLVIIAFSGHGVHLDDKSYLCPTDCTLDKAETLVRVDGIYDRLQDCAAGFKLVLIDACRNDPSPGGTRTLKPDQGARTLAQCLQELKVPEGVVLLNSCAPGEISWEDEKFGHGVFMHYVLDGMRGAADYTSDGSVSLNELQAYAGTRTKTYVANKYAVTQRPFFKGDLSTEALEYALLPIPGGAKPMLPPEPAMPKPAEVAKPSVVPEPAKPQPQPSQIPSQPVVARFPANTSLKPNQPWVGASFWQINQRAVVVIGCLADGPAGKAGLQADDVVLTVGGKKVGADEGFVPQAARTAQPGDLLVLEIERGDERRTVNITLEAAPADGGAERQLAAAEAGDVWAMMAVANVYRFGYPGFNANVEEALRWFRRAAESGDPRGLSNLAAMYQDGIVVAKDLDESKRLYEQALAAAGTKPCPGLIGKCYLGLSAIEYFGRQDSQKMLEYLQRSVDAGNLNAMTKLATFLADGTYGRQDYKQAMNYFHTAALEGYAPAAYNLGVMIRGGRGVRRDPTTARGWFENAAAGGIPDAMFALGYLYETGEGGPRDQNKALEWYRKAADLGNVDAKRKLQ